MTVVVALFVICLLLLLWFSYSWLILLTKIKEENITLKGVNLANPKQQPHPEVKLTLEQKTILTILRMGIQVKLPMHRYMRPVYFEKKNIPYHLVYRLTRL